jgi:serine/threonine protein kinase
MQRDAPGAILAGKYELIEKAGTGGMAVVWRGRTLGAAGFSRPVAIKRVIGHLATNPSFVAMFVEEARVVSRLQHPLIAQIHDFGVDEAGHHFLVMEWVEGVDVNELAKAYVLRAADVPWEGAVAIAIDVLGALGAAHSHVAEGVAVPVFHRDVTPQNVRVSVDGFAKLTDFGIARAMDRVSMTTPNAIKGKVQYVAPEQVLGGPATIQTDLYSLGICIWEALAGRRLFDAPSDMQVIMMVQEGRVPDVRMTRPDVPDALWSVLERALARDPSRRYTSAGEMARALSAVLSAAGETIDRERIASTVRDARARLDEHIEEKRNRSERLTRHE